MSRKDLGDLPKTNSAGEIPVDLQGILWIADRVTGKKKPNLSENHML